MKKKLQMYAFVALAFASIGNLTAQERVVTGTVTLEEDGSALPGVNVVLKGTTKGTITDTDGNYTISVPTKGGGGYLYSHLLDLRP